ncbi:hypothetical protein OsI_23117 [Oryza sativa Indica Group]|uniref:Uncharacterized protein n=1 Tax=Oryza sativa subsp. indica TaxID=39946 RepID=A2YDC8_ORYSI|nr:hypothetical protein OsI_23117 [Oryza sativa Indica Group]
MDKVWKSKEKAQMTNLQEGQLHAAQLEDGPLFGPMFVGRRRRWLSGAGWSGRDPALVEAGTTERSPMRGYAHLVRRHVLENGGGPDVDVDELPDASLGALVLEGVHVRGVDVHKVD